MFNFIRNISLKLILLLLVVAAFIPTQVSADDRLDSDCPINLFFSAQPSEVKSWASVVEIKTEVRREYAMGYYCGTDDTVQVTILYQFTGGQNAVLRTGNFLLPANPTGQGERTIKSESIQFDFSNRGGTNQTGLVIGGYATVIRRAGYGQKSFDITAYQLATVRLNKNTTVPPVTPNPGGGNTNNPSNTNAPNPGLNNNQINTGIGVNFNVDLDSDLGTFFNPLVVNSLPELVAVILRILFVLIGIAAVIVIIIAGFRMVVDSGNETQLKKAKEAITWAVIGLIVSILAFSIVAIIQKVIQG